MANGFASFGGVPKAPAIDYPRAAVMKANWLDPEFGPKIESFCQNYRSVILPTTPYIPRHKGKVGSGIMLGRSMNGRGLGPC